MHVVNVSELPAGEGSRSVSLEGEQIGGVDVSIIFVDLDPGRGPRLHRHDYPEVFVIPNAWDAGSARVLEGLGFQAIATTSSGFAFTLGRGDGEVTLDELAAHVGSLAAATSLPISVDLENGFGPDPADAARAIER